MRLVTLLVTFVISASSSAQVMYRCHDEGRTIYSDKPCLNGVEVKQLAPTGGPSREEIGRQQMKTRAEQQREMDKQRAERAAKANAANNKAVVPGASPATPKPDGEVMQQTADGRTKSSPTK